jgi:hypothetical protein
MSGLRTSLEAQGLYRPHHEEIQTSNQTNARRRGPVRRCTLPGHLPLEPAAHLAEGYEQCSYHKDMQHTCRTTGISKTPSGMADCSSHCHLPRLEESLMSLGSLNSRKMGEVELSRALIGRSTSYSEAIEHKKAEGNKNLTIGKF